jgi:hypothetical protein
VRHEPRRRVALIFGFIDNGQPILSSMMRNYRQLATGVGFDIKTKTKIYMISSYITISSKGDPESSYENPMQPEVIKYIKENWDKINDCFKELAVQKGINKK